MGVGLGLGVVLFGTVSEVVQGSKTNLELGAYGTVARIVDWDQLPNGLLGITIEGGSRFHIQETWREDSGLNMASVEIDPALPEVALPETGRSMIDVLAGLQRHPEVRKLGMTVNTGNAWEVCFALLQLLPVGSAINTSYLASMIFTSSLRRSTKSLLNCLAELLGLG